MKTVPKILEEMRLTARDAVITSVKQVKEICEESGETFRIEKAFTHGESSYIELSFVKVIAERYDLNDRELMKLFSEVQQHAGGKFKEAVADLVAENK
jgi:hypothetical protein